MFANWFFSNKRNLLILSVMKEWTENTFPCIILVASCEVLYT